MKCIVIILCSHLLLFSSLALSMQEDNLSDEVLKMMAETWPLRSRLSQMGKDPLKFNQIKHRHNKITEQLDKVIECSRNADAMLLREPQDKLAANAFISLAKYFLHEAKHKLGKCESISTPMKAKL